MGFRIFSAFFIYAMKPTTGGQFPGNIQSAPLSSLQLLPLYFPKGRVTYASGRANQI